MNVTEAYMLETRVGAHDVLTKIAAIAETSNGVPAAPSKPVHPHKTKAVAAENAAAFRGLLGA